MNPGDVLADPEHPGLCVRCVGEQRVLYCRYKNPSGAPQQVEIGVLGALKLTEIRAKWRGLKASHYTQVMDLSRSPVKRYAFTQDQ